MSARHEEPLMLARAIVNEASSDTMPTPVVRSFFNEPTSSVSHVVHDPVTRSAAIIDAVLDFDVAAARVAYHSAEQIVSYAKSERLTVEWLLESHAHADHLSAAPYLQERLGGKLAIGRGIIAVQDVFGKIFNEGTAFQCDGSQFDRLFADGDSFTIGSLRGLVLHVPGHTPADVAYVIGDAVFVGDTLFMPDCGTARADFPGGDARQLYRSIRRLMDLPAHTRMFLCHDYKAPGRDQYKWETTIGEQSASNVHAREGIGEEEFVEMRTRRDATLSMPKLILSAIQVNMRAGHLPAPEANGIRYLKMPLNSL